MAMASLFAHYEHNPALAAVPHRTVNDGGRPGDPVNVALIGTEPELVAAMLAAGWAEAAPLSLESAVGIACSVVFDVPDRSAPVSPLFLYGRREDLAFEREVGRSARRRHHVRFWRADNVTVSEHPVYLGAATFDTGIELSHTTLHVTHHIAPNLDEERESLFADLEAGGHLVERYAVTGIGPCWHDVNSEGDWFATDGEMWVGMLSAAGTPVGHTRVRRDPWWIRLKNAIWRAIRRPTAPAAPASTNPSASGVAEPGEPGVNPRSQ